MYPAMSYMCSIGSPPTKNFRLGHCFGPAYLLDLLHNPKCTGSSFSLNSPISTDQERVWSSFFFPSEQLSRITPSQRSSLEVVHQKYLFFDPPSLVRMWLTPSPCGRPHIALDTTLWSCSVKLVLRKYAAHSAHYHYIHL